MSSKQWPEVPQAELLLQHLFLLLKLQLVHTNWVRVSRQYVEVSRCKSSDGDAVESKIGATYAGVLLSSIWPAK